MNNNFERANRIPDLQYSAQKLPLTMILLQFLKLYFDFNIEMSSFQPSATVELAHNVFTTRHKNMLTVENGITDMVIPSSYAHMWYNVV